MFDSLNAFVREFVFGGHLLAFGTASIAASAAFLLGRAPTFLLLLMAYLFSFGAYMLNRGSEMSQDIVSNPLRTNFLYGRSRYLPAISAASFTIGYLIAASVNFVFLAALLLPLVLALVYTIGSKKLIGLMGARRLKDKLLTKNIAISFGWSLVPILVGLYYARVPFILIAFAPFIFFRLMSNTIFFDLRDVSADSEFGVKTVPVVFGETKSHQIMSLFDLASAFYVVALLLFHVFPIFSAVLLALPAYSLLYRWAARKPGANLSFLCDFVADGEFLFWGPLILFGKII